VPDERKDLVLGPLFTLGAATVALGLARRAWTLAAVGAAAMWADERTALGRRLKKALVPDLDS